MVIYQKLLNFDLLWKKYGKIRKTMELWLTMEKPQPGIRGLERSPHKRSYPSRERTGSDSSMAIGAEHR